MNFTSGRVAHSVFARTIKFGIEVWKSNKEFEELQKIDSVLPEPQTIKSNFLANTVIVVIGESAHRNHHSIYGYSLPTTPYLETMSDEGLYVFSNTIASSACTAGNMERILTFKEDDKVFGDGLKYPRLIDFFKAAGYKVYWFSNQERIGIVSNTSGVMAASADVIRYIGAEHSEDIQYQKFDEDLLPLLYDALNESEDHKLIFLHLIGSHTKFNQRYPKKNDYFSAEDELKVFDFSWMDKNMAQTRAEYDNSIRYTDNLLGRIIDCVSGQDDSMLALYFSDHGENVYDTGSYIGRDENCAMVPFIIFANNSYMQQNPMMIQQIEDAVDKPISTANIVHMLITLTGSDYFLYNPELDGLSDSFKIRPRFVDEVEWINDIAK